MVITFADIANQGGEATGGTVSGITLWSDEYTKEYIDDKVDEVVSDELTAYTLTTDFATINGSAITHGGNIVIGSGGATAGTIDEITLWSDETIMHYVDDMLSAYTKTDRFATINGSAITHGGNIVIQGGTGGTEYSAGTNIQISNNVISVTGITNVMNDMQTQIDGLDDSLSGFSASTINDIQHIWSGMSYIDMKINDVSPAEVDYKTWEWDDNQQKWVYEDEWNFESVDEMYNYIRECKHMGCPLYEDNGTYGITAPIDGKRYIFTSPVARYESLVDPDRKIKLYQEPNEGKLIVRKHIPVGTKSTEAQKSNPVIGSKYYFNGNRIYFDVYLPKGEQVKIHYTDELKVEDEGYANQIRYENDYIQKPYSLDYDGEEEVYILTNTCDEEEYDIEYLKYVFYIETDSHNIFVKIDKTLFYFSDDDGCYHLDISDLNIYQLKNEDSHQTNSIGFYFEQGRLKCSKPTRLTSTLLSRVQGKTYPIIKESNDTYVWKYYMDDSALHKWLFETDIRYRIVDRKHKSYVLNYDTVSAIKEKEFVQFKILDSNTLVVWRKSPEEFDDYSNIYLSLAGFDGNDATITITHPFDQTTDTAKYYCASDFSLVSFAGYQVRQSQMYYDTGTADDEKYLTIIKLWKKLKSYKRIDKTQDKYWKRIADYGTLHEGSAPVVFRVWNKYKGIKSQIPMYLVVKITSPEHIIQNKGDEI